MIDKTAIVNKNAKVHPSAKIGPYAVIGPNVEIGENTEIHSHVSITGNTKIGKSNKIYPFVSINDPQDLKYNGEETSLVIGDNNKIREYVTINPGTIGGGGKTKIGNNCLLKQFYLSFIFPNKIFQIFCWITHYFRIISNIPYNTATTTYLYIVANFKMTRNTCLTSNHNIVA